MRRTILTHFVGLLLLSNPLLARDWEWVSGGNFSSMTVQSGGDIVWLTGNLLVKGVRQNDGWHWTQVAPELTENSWVGGLVFSGGSAMVLTGTGVGYSSDGAHTWTIHPLPEWISTISRFQMTAPSNAYAVGQHTDGRAILVSTENGGTSWELIFDSGEWSGFFTDLKIYPDGHATLVGNYFSNFMGWLGIVIETTDNFQTVARVDYDDQTLWRLEAPTRADHYALGGPDLPGFPRPLFAYRHQENGSWIRSELPADIFQILDLTFDSALHGWVVGHFDDPDVGRGGVLLETSDGAETWTRTDFCEGCVTERPIIEEPIGALTYIAKGGGDLFLGQSPLGGLPCPSYIECTGRVLVSSDGGQWNRVDKVSGYRYVDIALATDPLRGIAVGFDGRVWNSFTRNLSGQVWEDPSFHEVPCPFPGMCPPLWADIEIAGGSEVWASTRITNTAAQLMKSPDLGSTWAFVDTGDTISLQAPILSITSPDSIWSGIRTADNFGKIISTKDGGETWETLQEITGFSYFKISHVSDLQYCYVIRSMGCTQDGGQTWSSPAIPGEFVDLQLLDEEYGWALTYQQGEGVLDLYRTTDGGATWGKLAEIDGRATEVLSQLKFINRQQGWLAVGTNTDPRPLLRTVDGGETWTEATDGVFLHNEATYGFVFDVASDGTGWLASRYSGMLLKRSATEPIAPGDANGDGKLDSGDMLEILKGLNDGGSAAGKTDCNGDGKTDVGDLICIILKLEEK